MGIACLGAQSNGCRFDKKPQYRYSGCHSHDSSALNIVLGLAFQFDDSSYSFHLSPETYFHTVTAAGAADELARLQDNMTDTTDSWENENKDTYHVICSVRCLDLTCVSYQQWENIFNM